MVKKALQGKLQQKVTHIRQKSGRSDLTDTSEDKSEAELEAEMEAFANPASTCEDIFVQSGNCQRTLLAMVQGLKSETGDQLLGDFIDWQ